MADDDRWRERRSREPRYERDDPRDRDGFWGRGQDDDGFRSGGSRDYSREDYGSTGRGSSLRGERLDDRSVREIGRVYHDDSRPRDDYRGRGDGDRYRSAPGRDAQDRGFFERASDEVASWFGDRDAEQRREMDHRGRGPKGYRRSDARIQDDVSDRLADDRYVDASDIEVSASGGEVTLSGTVDSRSARRRAEDLAEQVSGVSYVQNNLRLGQSSSGFAGTMEAARTGPEASISSTLGGAASSSERNGGIGDRPRTAN